MAFAYLADNSIKLVAGQTKEAASNVDLEKTKEIVRKANKLTRIILEYLKSYELEDVDIDYVLSFIKENRHNFPKNVSVKNVLIAVATYKSAENPVQLALLEDLREEITEVEINIGIDDYLKILEEEATKKDTNQTLRNAFGGINLHIRIMKRLSRAGISTLQELLAYTPSRLNELEGIGPKIVKDILIALTERGESLQIENREIIEQTALPFLPNADLTALGLGISLNPLIRAGFTTIGEILRCTEDDLLGIRNLGIVKVQSIHNALRSHGQSLREENTPLTLYSEIKDSFPLKDQVIATFESKGINTIADLTEFPFRRIKSFLSESRNEYELHEDLHIIKSILYSQGIGFKKEDVEG